jgi:hypothetical protein
MYDRSNQKYNVNFFVRHAATIAAAISTNYSFTRVTLILRLDKKSLVDKKYFSMGSWVRKMAKRQKR